MTDQKAAGGPQERPEGGSAGLRPSETENGAQAGADSLGLREVIAGAIWDANSIHPGTIADAVYTRLKPHLAPHYQRAVDTANAAEQRALEAEATVARVRAARDRIGRANAREVDAIYCLDLIEEALDPPAHNAGPTVAECAEADRRWWGSQKAGE